MKAPLSERMRPKTLDEMVGQHHLFGEGKPLRRLLLTGIPLNLIFYGPPGTGKTTAARIISEMSHRKYEYLNATTSGTQDFKNIFHEEGMFRPPNGTMLHLDEIQYFNKKQQQTLLSAIESGEFTLVASTTENPYHTIYGALLSRVHVFEFHPITEDEMKEAIKRGFQRIEKEINGKLIIEEGVIETIARGSCGDVRKALNKVELIAAASDAGEQFLSITQKTAESLIGDGYTRYMKDGDEYYDLLSAFQKSLRGSDADAAIYYLARLLKSGDLISICRRLLVCASEDVGLAYPQILPIVKSSVDIALQVGLPEARIPLADAVIMVSKAPKSNTAYKAMNEAVKDIEEGKAYPIPEYLRMNDHEVLGKEERYKYPHDYPKGYVQQNYLPKELEKRTYYHYGRNKWETSLCEYWLGVKGRSEEEQEKDSVNESKRCKNE